MSDMQEQQAPMEARDKELRDEEPRNEEPRVARIEQTPTTRSGVQDITIKRVENGFIVKVGCKTLVAEKWKSVSEGLELYFKDPEAAYKKYVETKE